MLKAFAFQIFLGLFLQMQHHIGAGEVFRSFRHSKGALAIGNPAPGLGFASLAGNHFNLVGNHEGGVEAHAELADQVHVFLGVTT